MSLSRRIADGPQQDPYCPLCHHYHADEVGCVEHPITLEEKMSLFEKRRRDNELPVSDITGK